MIISQRTFHPVGHGAFFVERFFNDYKEHPFFTVVYDCGNKDKKHLTRIINGTFNNNEQIHLLFISHFDADHISGIEELIVKNHVNKDTIVIVPFSYPKAITIMGGAYKKIASLITTLMSIGAHLVGILGEYSINENEESINYDNLRNRNNISNGIKISHNNIWFYVPFMTCDRHSLQEKFDEELSNNRINKDCLNDSDWINQNKKVLKRIYDNVGVKGNTTNINMNSLLLLSYSAKPEIDYWFNCCSYRHFCCSWCITPARMYIDITSYSSCLYTGDADLSSKKVFDNITFFSRKRINQDIIGILQIPHHGSINNYSTHIACSHNYYAAVINCDPYYHQKILSDKILIDFAQRHRQLLLVKKDDNSVFRQMFFLK